ncbi:MAG: hypothetical protein HY721_00980 [Planctomycetes bacterium]|nr:hypothetical protein [Planctomycetota bacterium]
MRRMLFTAALALYALHQDFWLWGSARPLLLGFLPPGLAYHAAYTLVASALLGLLVRHAWPAELPRGLSESRETR